MARNNIVGSWGEAVAAQYLQGKRFKIVATNYRSRFGEIDLVARDRKHLIFVEVKLRKSSNFAAAAEHVDTRKQERLRTTAELYLAEFPTDLQPRFDVIEVYAPYGVDTRDPVINHMEDVF